MTFIVYREKTSNRIVGYSFYFKAPENLQDKIKKYNEESEKEIAEEVLSNDLIAVLELAEKNKKIKESDIRNVIDKLDDVQNEIYLLKENLK